MFSLPPSQSADGSVTRLCRECNNPCAGDQDTCFLHQKITLGASVKRQSAPNAPSQDNDDFDDTMSYFSSALSESSDHAHTVTTRRARSVQPFVYGGRNGNATTDSTVARFRLFNKNAKKSQACDPISDLDTSHGRNATDALSEAVSHSFAGTASFRSKSFAEKSVQVTQIMAKLGPQQASKRPYKRVDESLLPEEVRNLQASPCGHGHVYAAWRAYAKPLGVLLVVLLALTAYDIKKKYDAAVKNHVMDQKYCQEEFERSECDPDTIVPALHVYCFEMQKCIDRLAHEQITVMTTCAQYFGEVVESFLNPLTTRSLLFLVVAVSIGVIMAFVCRKIYKP